MAERKFRQGLSKPGMAAQVRETVSQVVRQTAVQSKLQRTEPIDYESVLDKSRLIFNNDPHRELLLFPPEDIAQGKIKRECRTIRSTVPNQVLENQQNYFAYKCAQFYTSDWSTVTYKYAAYSGNYLLLPNRTDKATILMDPKHEMDLEGDADEDTFYLESPPTHEGYLLKGPEGANEKVFVNIATKSFKRRFCKLRQDITSSYYLDICKEEKKQEATCSICLDECVEILRNVRRNKFGFQLRLTNQRSYIFAAGSELELNQWLEKLSLAVHSSKAIGEDKKPPLDKEIKEPPSYGTLRSLENSLNPQLAKYARETETSIAMARRDSRHQLFTLCPSLPTWLNDKLVNPCRVDPYKEKLMHRILVSCQSIQFRLQAPIDGEKGPLGQVEPYLTTMALYDLKLNKKLTEDFHFDINEEHVRPSSRSFDEVDVDPMIPANWLSHPQQAAFSISNCHSDIFLVIRIETILQGSISSALEPYMKPNSDSKTALKVQKMARFYGNRLGKYRMPFAWTARPLFRSSGELDTTCECTSIFRQELQQDLLKSLNDLRKPEKVSRWPTISGCVKVKIDYLHSTLPNMLTSSLVPIDPFPVPPSEQPTLEVTEFPSVRVEDAYPFTGYVNHLYVYPRSLKYDAQKTFHRARNLACIVELRDSDVKDAKPLKCIYAQPAQSGMISQWVCSVLHHVTCPQWYDEVKVDLPTTLTTKHHLLFTFVHVSCDLSKQKKDKDSGNPETVVGYSWLPLIHKGRLRVEQQSLPVSAHLPAGYLSFEPLGLGRGYAGPEIRWVDNQKPLFVLQMELVSTVTARDQHLHNFFLHMAKLNETRPLAAFLPATSQPETIKSNEDAPKSPILQDGCRELSKLVKATDLVSKILKALHAVDVAVIIHHLPVILNKLMWLIIRINNEEVSANVVKVLIHIVHELHQVKKESILDTYLQYVFVTPSLVDSAHKATVHEEMVKTLCLLLRPTNTDFLVMHKFLRHAGFFFVLITRSMAQHIIDTGRIKMQRHERFHSSYLESVKCLIETISPHIQHKYKDLPDETCHANLAIAEFIKKCMSLMDRGFAFRLMDIYLKTFRSDDPRILYEFKFQFLQWICYHEHYIPLNLPRSPNWAAMKNAKELEVEFRLCDVFAKNHYLAGLLLQEVRSSLNEVTDVRKMGLRCLRDILTKHELDDRYQQKGHQSRIATLYLPWIFIVLDNWNRLNVLPADTIPIAATVDCSLKSGQSRSLPRNTLPLSQTPISSWQRNTISSYSQSSKAEFNTQRNSSYLAIIAGQSTSSQATLTNGNSATSLGESDNSSTLSFETLTIGESTDVCDLAADKGTNKKADSANNHSRNNSIAAPIVRYDKLQPEEVKDVLLCLLYVVKHADSEALVAWWHHATQHDLICFFHVFELCLRQFKYLGRRRSGEVTKSSTLPARVAPPPFTSRTCNAYEAEILSTSDGEGVYRGLLEANLATEVGLVVLDSVGLFCIHFKDMLLFLDGDNALMRKVLDIYLSFLQIGQSESLSKHVFAALRAFINNFSVALFQGNAWLCGRLCCEVLRCCASKLSLVRQEACAVLYLLMRSNFQFSGQKALTRVHLQVIISVSQLLGEIGGLNSTRFAESLSVINGFASSDKAMQNTLFPGEVRDLTKRALTVLKATSQMRQQAQDPELLIDLQHSLANSYSATPELRKTWLQTMARHHSRLGNWSEVALCEIHIAALMAEYLRCRGLRQDGCKAFSNLSANIVCDESNLRLDTGVHDTQYDDDTLLEQLEECGRAVEKAERYEMLIELYRLILPTYEQRRDFTALSEAFTALSQACARAAEANRTKKRLLGTYYRVALYGEARFADESGTEYIYKEPKVTSLSEISDRLKRLYSAKFGADNVKLVMDSNVMQDKDMEPLIAYVQVTHVVPYFDDELTERVTEFERNHNVKRFSYEVPFTVDGKVRGSPEEQCKRRIVLTTQYSFPYVKKRLRVVSRETFDLSPIEVALDEMNVRVKEIAEVVRNQPTDLKKLQLRLQGSISVQVNAGPLAYASAFLLQNSAAYPEDQVQQLRDLYRDFVSICAAALELNGKLILADQREYHEALRCSFRELVNSLATILEDPSLLNSEWEGSVNSSLFHKRSSVLVFSAISGNGSSSA